MLPRERWIIYPLLTLALGWACYDKLMARQVDTSTVRCQRLIVEGPGGYPVLDARCDVRDGQGHPIPLVTCRALRLRGPQGDPGVIMVWNPEEKRVRTIPLVQPPQEQPAEGSGEKDDASPAAEDEPPDGKSDDAPDDATGEDNEKASGASGGKSKDPPEKDAEDAAQPDGESKPDPGDKAAETTEPPAERE